MDYLVGRERRRSPRGGTMARLGTTALIAVMLAMAVMPLFSNGAFAKTDDTITSSSNATLQTDATALQPVGADTDPVTDQPSMVDDPVVVDPGVELTPVVDPDPVAVGTIQVAKYGCDQEWGGDYAQLAGNCWSMDAPFAVSSGSGEQDYTGSFSDDQVAAGNVTVTEAVPAGYGTPIVFCHSYAADGSVGDTWQAQIVDGGLSYGLASAETLTCDWYNVPSTPTTDNVDGSIVIHKWECPENLAFIQAPTASDLLTACTQSMDDVTFDLSYPTDQMLQGQSRTTGDDGAGTASFDGVQPGSVAVQEQIPSGYGDPIVACGWGAIYDPNGNGQLVAVDGKIPPTTLPGGTLSLDWYPSEQMSCDWFNFPDDGGTIVLHKWECPEGLDTEGATREYLLSECSQPMANVDFAVTKTDGTGIAELSTDDSGLVSFDGLAASDLVLTEAIPAGYGTPIVWCSQSEGEAVAYDVTEGAIGVGFDGYKLTCDWFNLPSGGTIVIHKWVCPAGWNPYDANYDDLSTTCTDPMAGIDFTLGGHNSQVFGIENTDDSGYAEFADVASNNYTLTEALPTGYATPIVWCHQSEGESVRYDVTDGGLIELSYDGYKLVCDWYNVPTTDGSITIYKYTCPEGYNLSLAADPKADCLDLTNGITFTLDGTGGYHSQSDTGDSLPGGVYFGGLEPDTYTVQETIPAGTADTRVACTEYDPDGSFTALSNALYNSYGGAGIGNALDLDLYHGERIVCLWFNALQWHGGNLTVTKYWCDGNIYDIQHCDLYSGGADFVLSYTDGSGSTVPFTTGIDGTYTLNLDAGEYGLQEVNRTWCRAESNQVNADGHVVITDGQDSSITVFNCGPGKKKEPPVKKFPNTGVAPGAAQVAVTASATTLAPAGSQTSILFGAAGLVLLAGMGAAVRRPRLVSRKRAA